MISYLSFWQHVEHFFLSSFEKIGKMTFPEPPPAPQVVKIPDFFLKIFNEVFPKGSILPNRYNRHIQLDTLCDTGDTCVLNNVNNNVVLPG